MNKPAVMLPTYNEADNIREMIAAIHRVAPGATVLVVDDDSPDGTWRIVEEMARDDNRVQLLRRTENRGRGYAGAAGFRGAPQQLIADGECAEEFISESELANPTDRNIEFARHCRGSEPGER